MVDAEAKRIINSLPEAGRYKQEVWSYVRDLRSTGLVSGLLIGDRPGERCAYFCHVFRTDVTGDDTSADQYLNLFERVSQFEIAAGKAMPIRTSGVNPSRLTDRMQECAVKGINLELLRF
jgi:hypothetical protein